ncbi:MAG: flagellar biosynthesis protein FlgN [Rectinemataceae bacterium]
MAARHDGEFEKRVALLHRLRELLLDQRHKFERYLEVLDHEKGDIESDDVDRLVAHVEIEEGIVSEIYTFQKAIDPLEELYRAALPMGDPAGREVGSLRSSLQDLRKEVLRRNEENRSLLRTRMEDVRLQILTNRKALGARRVYSNEERGTILDLGA